MKRQKLISSKIEDLFKNIDKFNRILIIGKTGSGKSVALSRVMWNIPSGIFLSEGISPKKGEKLIDYAINNQVSIIIDSGCLNKDLTEYFFENLLRIDVDIKVIVTIQKESEIGDLISKFDLIITMEEER